MPTAGAQPPPVAAAHYSIVAARGKGGGRKIGPRPRKGRVIRADETGLLVAPVPRFGYNRERRTARAVRLRKIYRGGPPMEEELRLRPQDLDRLIDWLRRSG